MVSTSFCVRDEGKALAVLGGGAILRQQCQQVFGSDITSPELHGHFGLMEKADVIVETKSGTSALLGGVSNGLSWNSHPHAKELLIAC